MFECVECKRKDLKGYYMSTCPMCKYVDFYPKLPGQKQVISCSNDDVIFETDFDTCEKRIGLCTHCEEGVVVDHQQPKSGGFYPEVTVPIKLQCL